MFYLFFFLIWFTPALIAGLLGWPGIWGTGSAFTEYLIPVPVAGGAFHIPGLIVSFIVLKLLNGETPNLNKTINYAVFVIFIGVLSLHIDFPRFYNWLTTDYKPHGSPIRFESNTLYLFALTDAFWLWIYSMVKGVGFNKINVISLILIPPAVLAFQFFGKSAAGPDFQIGGSYPGPERGQETQYIFTTARYDKELLLAWLEERAYLGDPWQNPNTEHEAIVFVNSLELIKWRKFNEITDKHAIATVCSYEEDKSRSIHPGLFNCFSGKETINQKLKKIIIKNPSGFESWVDNWYARALLCKSVEIPPDRMRHDIALYNTCINLSRHFDENMKKLSDRYGENSEVMRFIREKAKQANLPKTIPPIQ